MIRHCIHQLARKLVNATKLKQAPYSPKLNELSGGIRHVVYEYSNLVCAHVYLEAHPDGGPTAILVLNAFLLSIRLLAGFLGKPTGKPDILATHYSGQAPRRLQEFGKRKDAIDKQLAHISYARVTKPQPDLADVNTGRALFAELRTAFLDFLSTVQEKTHRDEFAKWLAMRSAETGCALP